MVKVYLNPGKLDEKLAAIDKFSESVRATYGNIGRYYNNDPIEGGEDLRFYLDAFVSEGDDLIIHTLRIKRIKTNIEQLNSSGVATADIDGRITFEAPNDSVESPEKFQMWSRGYLDANDLSAGKSPLPSGRSIDEVRESMKFNKDDSTYANTFIDRIGPENLLKLGDKNPDNNREAPIFGKILATASRTWGEEKSKRNAKLILDSFEIEPLIDSRVPIFTKMMVHDDDGDGLNDLKFGTSFLVSLGKEAEAKAPEWPPNKKVDIYKIYATEFDPLYTVIGAMTGNEEASRVFLAPNGGSADDATRMRTLIHRHDIGNNKWTDTWAGISARTSEAHGTDQYDETTRSPESHQTAAIAAAVVNSIGEKIQQNGTSSQVSGATRSRLSYTLSKFPYAIDYTVEKGKANSINSEGKPVPLNSILPRQEASWSQGMGWQPPFTVNGLSGAIQAISEDSNDLKRVTEPLGNIHLVKMIDAAADKGDVAKLKQTIAINSDANGFILGASRARIEGDAAKKEENDQVLRDTVFSVFDALPGAGDAIKGLAGTIVDYGKNRSVDALKAQMEKESSGGLDGARMVSGSKYSEASQTNLENTIIQLMSLGVIDGKAIAAGEVYDGNGTPLSFRDENGHLDLSKLRVEGSAERDYLIQRYVSEPEDMDPTVHQGLSEMGGNFDVAYQKGRGGISKNKW